MLPTDDLRHILEQTRDLWEELRRKRLFLTGGTGFFGTWLLHVFTYCNDQLALDAHVTVLTRDPESFSKKIPELSNHPAVTLLPGDVTSFTFSDGDFSHVIHAAGEVINGESDALRKTMVDGTKRVLAFGDVRHVQKMLLVSSGAVYGPQPSDVTHMPEDDDAVQRPFPSLSAYAQGKRDAEALWRASDDSQTRTIARCYAFVGPYLPLDAHFAAGNFIRDGLTGGPIIINGDGTPYRSYLYAADLAIWLLTILCRGKTGRAYNVGSENAVTITGLANAVAAAFTPPATVTITKTPVPGIAPERYVPSTARVRTELGLRETVSLEQAIRKTVAWYSR